MKILSVGDIHGKSVWKQIDVTLYDKIIFVGDYVDDYTVSNDIMVNNLVDIINFKKLFPEKIVLLLGNHDIHYIHWPDFKGAGLNLEIFKEIRTLFLDNIHLFQIAYQIKDVVWTHAGISQTWLEHNRLSNVVERNKIANYLNSMYKYGQLKTLFQVGKKRKGAFPSGGPVWCDKSELMENPCTGINQIVGHSRCLDVTSLTIENNWLVNCNCLDFKTNFFELTL